MPNADNLFSELPETLPHELVQTLLHSPSVRIDRIVSQGHKSADGFWYDQAEHEWVLLVTGAARLQFENETLELVPGAFVNIPAHCKHRVAWTDPQQQTVWLAVFLCLRNGCSQSCAENAFRLVKELRRGGREVLSRRCHRRLYTEGKRRRRRCPR